MAEAIAKAAGVSAEALAQGSALSEPTDLLFIGDGVYAAQINSKTRAFIERLDGASVKKAAVFGTFGSQDTAITTMTELLKAKNIDVCERSFSCRGKAFIFLNKNHPDEEELRDAAAFAESVVKQAENS